MKCRDCLFCAKGQCVWYERSIEADKAPLCGAVHFEAKAAEEEGRKTVN